MSQADIKNVLLIGAMKCGTSSLYDYLIQHPEVCSPVIKEPEYFSATLGHKKYKEGTYEDLFYFDASKHRFMLDASTGYTKYPTESGVPGRIKEYGIDPFLIYIVRNPFDRIQSHYNFMLQDPSWNCQIDSPHLINTSKYSMQLEQYLEFFPKDRILLLTFEELIRDPKAVTERALSFIGASPLNITFDFQVKNKTKPVNRKRVKLDAKLHPAVKRMPSLIQRSISKVEDIIFPVKKKKLSPDEHSRIRDLLSEDMSRLEKEFGIPVGEWGF